MKLFRWRLAELDQVEVAEKPSPLSSRPLSREERTARLNAARAAQRDPRYRPPSEEKPDNEMRRRMRWGPDWTE